MRRLVLIVCVFLSTVLFVNGVSILSDSRLDSERDNKIEYENDSVSYGNKSLSRESAEPKKKPVNILLLGLDDEEARSDVIMLVNFNPSGGEINILSIARDTRVKVKGKMEKINALSAIGGEALILKAVQQITGLPVEYYVTLNFEGFRKIIDTLGGVVLDVPMDMHYDDPAQNLHIHLDKGIQLLDGDKAEQFVRYRKGNNRNEGYVDGDIGRNRAQQQLVRNLIDQKLNFKHISWADDIYLILRKYMKTNIKIEDIAYYINDLGNLDCNKVKTFTIPGDSKNINGVWYYICDWDGTKKLIDDYFLK